MHILFVHGMGRTPLSGQRMLYKLRKQGLHTSSFLYVAALQKFESIEHRLISRIEELAASDDYVLVGHSLGGVLLRSAVNKLQVGTTLPVHMFLLGSPIRASSIARKLSKRLVYKFLTGDCGKVLSSESRMLSIGTSKVKQTNITNIIGVRGLKGRFSPFGVELNDGVVSVSETSAPWIKDEVHVPVNHTLLPSSSIVARLITDRLSKHGFKL